MRYRIIDRQVWWGDRTDRTRGVIRLQRRLWGLFWVTETCKYHDGTSGSRGYAIEGCRDRLAEVRALPNVVRSTIWDSANQDRAKAGALSVLDSTCDG